MAREIAGVAYAHPVAATLATNAARLHTLTMRDQVVYSGANTWEFDIALEPIAPTDHRWSVLQGELAAAGRHEVVVLSPPHRVEPTPLDGGDVTGDPILVERDAPEGSGEVHVERSSDSLTIPPGTFLAFGTPGTVEHHRKLYQTYAAIPASLAAGGGTMALLISPPLARDVAAGEPVQWWRGWFRHVADPTVSTDAAGLVRHTLHLREAL